MSGNHIIKESGMTKKYILNCFLLLLPVMLWNILLTNKLPHEFQAAIFWKDIPVFISYGENLSRFLIFGLTFLMPLKIETNRQRKALILYVTGLLLYFSSWLLLINFPQSAWKSNLLGFMAPAYTPLFWLMGIGLIGNSFYFKLPYKKWYFLISSMVFLLFHNLHAYIVFSRVYE